ncbi:MAG: formylglycine-generating enzyme family protein, partial [Planctomycetota bacterium]
LTRRQWQAATGEEPPRLEGLEADPDHPVTRVSWRAVTETLLPTLQPRAPEGWEVRLPTEAEWEYACRAGTHTRYFPGDADDSLQAVAWTAASDAPHLHPVGRLEPNAFGLYDMHGNVAEWCADSYTQSFYLTGATADPRNTAERPHRVVRGGGFINLPIHCRSAYRSYAHAENSYPFLGVRLVLAPRPPAPTPPPAEDATPPAQPDAAPVPPAE